MKGIPMDNSVDPQRKGELLQMVAAAQRSTTLRQQNHPGSHFMKIKFRFEIL